jgi:DNA-binding transcriptional LysR family regulator
MRGRTPPIDPTGLSEFDGIVLRSSLTGRLRHRIMRDAIGTELPAALNETIVVNDPAAMSRAAVLGLGVALISMPEALPYLESNALVRLVPSWYADLGPISLYFATRTLLPAKTRVFVDFVLEAFRRDRFGVNYILPLLPEFLGRYPRIRADWQFDNRVVDLIAEGFDAAIGGGFDLPPAVISRVLAPLHYCGCVDSCGEDS